MRVSIIIPVYNEEKTIRKLLRTLEPVKEKAEILFVDGGSTDRTLSLLPEEYKVVKGPKGRAWQMNLGAEKSRGNVLFFLHCDSELPKDAIEQIERVMRKYQVGCFGIAFHSKNIWMKCCQIISNHRIKDRKVMFGDQGIFIRRKLFFEMGGFPKLPIMEDYQFSLTLKEMGVKIGIAKKRIYTSDRRFKEGGRLKVMWKMNRLRAMYRRGVEIEKIADLYRDVR
ncbi:MAG: glycosyltransferase family 2 protein [Dorea sp.]|nr:TIGR04283 family arsenosugar biosynthesis glycosyltransferase [Sporofaciens musculi]MCI9421794.1 glycosyltransferase family 2 protein [Dorea sp.]